MDELYVTYVGDEHIENHYSGVSTVDDHDNNKYIYIFIYIIYTYIYIHIYRDIDIDIHKVIYPRM